MPWVAAADGAAPGVGGTLRRARLSRCSFAVAIWATGAIAHRASLGPLRGIVAAVWLATSPVAIYEALQPMSDMPVTAAWLVCWWLCFAPARIQRDGEGTSRRTPFDETAGLSPPAWPLRRRS